MKKYLIVKCEPLDDQYECDANRIPLCIAEDWKSLALDCEFFEAYEINEDGNISKCIKEWDDPVHAEKGMVLGYWSENTGEFIIEKKFVNRKPVDGIPAEVKAYLQTFSDYYDDDWKTSNYVCAYDYYNNEYIYGEYEGNEYPVSY